MVLCYRSFMIVTFEVLQIEDFSGVLLKFWDWSLELPRVFLGIRMGEIEGSVLELD